MNTTTTADLMPALFAVLLYLTVRLGLRWQGMYRQWRADCAGFRALEAEHPSDANTVAAAIAGLNTEQTSAGRGEDHPASPCGSPTLAALLAEVDAMEQAMDYAVGRLAGMEPVEAHEYAERLRAARSELVGVA